MKYIYNLFLFFSVFVFSVNSYAQDTDGDNIINSIDLDDDNDGILDTAEICKSAISTDFFYGQSATVNAVSGITVVPTTATLTPAVSRYSLGWHYGDATGAVGKEMSINFSNPVYFANDNIDFTLADLDNGSSFGNFFVVYEDGVRLSNLDFSLTNVTGDITTSTINGAKAFNSGLGPNSKGSLTLNGIDRTKRIIKMGYTVHALNGSSSTSENIIPRIQIDCDMDGDGIPNQLDLDSDGDGCPDVIEGGANFTSGASYITNDALNTTVNSSGVPAVPSATPTITGYDQTNGQTVNQAYTVNPAAVAGTASSSQTIVSGTSPLAITLTGSTGTIQWQSSTDNVTFANISGATSASYSPGTMTSTTYYRAVVSSLGGCSVNTNSVVITTVFSNTDSDGDGIPDSTDLDDDNDGILDTAECGNILKLSGFENIPGLSLGNNKYVNIAPWVLGPGDAANVVQVDGAGGFDYGSFGPFEDADPSTGAGVLQHYLDILDGFNSFYQVFTIPSTTTVTYSGYFSSRDNVNGNASLSICTGSNGLSGTVVDTSGLIAISAAGGSEFAPWVFIKRTVTLTPGTYSFVGYMNNDANFDDGKVEGCMDTNNDGTPDYLDLDSDGDGCPDVIEGGANFTSGASYITNDALNTTVNSSGVPAVPSATPTITGYDQTNGQTVNQAYTVNPTAVAGTANSNQTICWNTAPSAITLAGYTGTIQWQSSTDNVTFTNISGATSDSYSPGTLTSTTYFRAIVSSVGGCTVTSNTITITVNNCIDAVNDTYGPVTPGTSTTSVIANDKNNSGTAAVIGSGAGQVSISTATNATGTSGAWPTGFTLNADGTISVANGTAAGTYTLYYTICNQTAGSPCDTAAVTLTVPPTIDAIDGSQTVNSGSTGASVLANDTIQNGTAGSVTLGATGNATISQTNTTNAGVNIDTATGNVVVSPGTPAGIYIITYQICTKATPVTCDTATETVTVSEPTIDAVNGTQAVSAGTTGTTSVLANDTYNGGAAGSATLANVNLTQTATTNAGVTLNTTTGMITVAAGTPAGSYVVTYQICDKVNTGVCDIATETVNVAAPAIDAVTETTPAINGINGGTTASLLANDTLNGAPVTVGATGNVTLTPVTVPAGLTLNADGTVTVASGTPAGNYNVTYQICDKVNPTNCDTVTSIVVVSAPAIDAVNGTQAVSAGTTGTTSVLANDTYNGGAAGSATLANVNLTQTATTNAGVTLNTTTGMITVAAGTPAGSYVVTYQICDKVNTGVCDTATETVTVTFPFCYKPALTSGTALDTNHGITALGRAGDDNSNWPMVRKGAWTVLEAKTKGFVVNRLTDSQVSAIPSADLREGMMVYNITQDCLQINIDGTATGWRCFNTQTCPD